MASDHHGLWPVLGKGDQYWITGFMVNKWAVIWMLWEYFRYTDMKFYISPVESERQQETKKVRKKKKKKQFSQLQLFSSTAHP